MSNGSYVPFTFLLCDEKETGYVITCLRSRIKGKFTASRGKLK